MRGEFARQWGQCDYKCHSKEDLLGRINELISRGLTRSSVGGYARRWPSKHYRQEDFGTKHSK